MIRTVCRMLEARCFTLRSGGAEGADTMFERHAQRHELFLPWQGFNGRYVDDARAQPTAAAVVLASDVHPTWRDLTPVSKLLHARNVHQVLGLGLDEPVEFVVCWTPGGRTQGGTATAIKLANERSIPVVNLHSFTPLLVPDLVLTITGLVGRMFPPGAKLSPSGFVVMADDGRRARIDYRARRDAPGCCTWCGEMVIKPRRTWCSDACSESFLALDPGRLRSRCIDRDYSTCTTCGRHGYEVDHEVPISEGGHPFDLANLRVLCTECHAQETAALATRQATIRRMRSVVG